ncbi:sensor histidine kinase [Nocardia miyunensis]|uniref:sensor histidine kinase n=1 Tax=Nocardia miyunensis TaxID=282684 RepID=UPI000836645D|nr:nitrate- and nitrite sensing domain-containing protein [Nocardia miyunensis]
MFRPRFGVRTRILAVALVPSVVLLIIGVGGAGYVMTQGRHARDWARILAASTSQTSEFVTSAQLERQYSVGRLVASGGDSQPIRTARTRLDASLNALGTANVEMDKAGHTEVTGNVGGFRTLYAQLPKVRAEIDGGTMSVPDAYAFYGHFLDALSVGIGIVEADAPTPAVALAVRTALQLASASEMLSRSTALALVPANDATLPPELAVEYSRLVGGYRTAVESLASGSDAVAAVTKSPAWLRLASMENTFMTRALDPITVQRNKTGTDPAPMSFTVADWQNTANQVNNALQGLWDGQMRHADDLAAQAGDRNARNALTVGAALVLASLAAFGISLLLANRIIARLRRLRDRTLSMATERLPHIMQGLRAGQAIEASLESEPLDLGSDEIGQVADAFDQAQTAAISAAVTEARTREGVRTVFLNIAHRSQVVMHRQLEILDKAESGQEDPALLDIFFRLDHLATRERRNAENLIILAGGEPGRGWRNPVQLVDIVRSGISETVDFSRVGIARLPEITVAGTSVADLVHLLAELIDNAASFSPPQSRVEVRGNIVGKGVALEVVDQGVGMPAAELARINAMLLEPPDFGLASLSEDSRLGIFVVSQLARRNEISVRLAESEYGGVRAIVVIPSKLTVAAPVTSTGGWQAEPEHAQVSSPALSEPSNMPGGRSESSQPQPPSRIPHRAAPGRTVDPAREQPAQARHPASADNRPALPRRRRQASLAPELARERDTFDTPDPSSRTAEQARDLMSAIEDGTRQGRRDDSGGFDYRPTQF